MNKTCYTCIWAECINRSKMECRLLPPVVVRTFKDDDGLTHYGSKYPDVADDHYCSKWTEEENA